MEVDEQRVAITHEATVSKVGDEMLFYLRSRGLTEAEATLLIVNGFIEPFTKREPVMLVPNRSIALLAASRTRGCVVRPR